MIFKLWHKLALAIIGITGVILILALVVSQQSIKSGFLDYLNNIENTRIQNLSSRLINDYKFYDDWDYIRGKRGVWNRYLRDAKPLNAKKKKALDFQALAIRFDDGLPPPRRRNERRRLEDGDDRPPPPPRRNERRRRLEHQNDAFPPPGRRPPPPRPPRTAPLGISLLDANRQSVIGFKNHSKEAVNTPLVLNGRTIGYLRVEKFTKVIGELDQQFLEHQKQAFIKIAFIAFLLTMLAAWIIALYLRRRIDQIGTHSRQLTEGRYSMRIQHSSTDELGQLADNLNHLGKTLYENRQSRQQWIADISHELRTPLAILRGQVEALEDGIRPFDRKAIKLLGGEVNRLGKLVDDLFQLSLSDLGALSYSKESLNLSSLIEMTMDHFEERLTTKNLNLQISLASCSKVTILADSQRLRQLLINIVENSIRYTNAGGCIKVSCNQQDRSVFLLIEDSKPNVPSEQLEQLFERLYRGESSRNRKTGGAGLGLSIVKSIIEAHDGTITAKKSSLGGLLLELKFPIFPKI